MGSSTRRIGEPYPRIVSTDRSIASPLPLSSFRMAAFREVFDGNDKQERGEITIGRRQQTGNFRRISYTWSNVSRTMKNLLSMVGATIESERKAIYRRTSPHPRFTLLRRISHPFRTRTTRKHDSIGGIIVWGMKRDDLGDGGGGWSWKRIGEGRRWKFIQQVSPPDTEGSEGGRGEGGGRSRDNAIALRWKPDSLVIHESARRYQSLRPLETCRSA